MRDLVRTSRVLKRTGFGIMGTFAFFVSAFMVGETLSDPGGWKGVGMVAMWFVPMLALGALAWFKPSSGIPILIALSMGFLSLGIFRALDPAVVRYEDSNGPITAVVAFALAVAVAALGHERARSAGILLMLIGLSPILLVILMNSQGNGSPAGTAGFVLISPVAIPGVLLVLSDLVSRNTRPRKALEGQSNLRAAA